MNRIEGNDMDEIFYKILLDLKDAPEYAPRGQKVKELLNYGFTLNNPDLSVINSASRNLSEKYIKKEIEWYLSATPKIDGIKDHAAMWGQICDENQEVNSNYGVYIWNQKTPKDQTQFDFVVDTLKKDKDSRQALININQVKHKYDTKDFPCTLSMQYFIRDNKLHSIVNMRSNDVIFGLGNDAPFFTYVQHMVRDALIDSYPELEMGQYHHNAGSMHVYERHYDLMHKCILEYGHLSPSSKSITDLLLYK